jgi:hypothetical protein
MRLSIFKKTCICWLIMSVINILSRTDKEHKHTSACNYEGNLYSCVISRNIKDDLGTRHPEFHSRYKTYAEVLTHT